MPEEQLTDEIVFTESIDLESLLSSFGDIIYRGVYDKDGNNLHPYHSAKFSLAKVYPPTTIGAPPKIVLDETDENLFGHKKEANLFTAQPTIYQNQLEILQAVDTFLRLKNIKLNELNGAVKYHWKDRGDFHMLPPIIEKHSYDLENGYLMLDKLRQRFEGCYVRDAKRNLHHLADRYLNNFYIDEVSNINHFDIFHSHAPIINYGLNHSGKFDFYVICDGSHRIDYAIENLNEPINVIVVEPLPGTEMLPYYAFPVSFWPTMRLSSKQSEKIYVRLERDKIHLFSDLIKKILHYDWLPAGLMVTKLRSNTDIY